MFRKMVLGTKNVQGNGSWNKKCSRIRPPDHQKKQKTEANSMKAVSWNKRSLPFDGQFVNLLQVRGYDVTKLKALVRMWACTRDVDVCAMPPTP